MKKFVLTVLSMGLLLNACSSDELDTELSRDYATYVGEFKSLGGVEVNEIITHLFETDEGEILYAYSDRYDLDSEDYFGIEVEAYGVLTTYEDLEKPLFEVKQITDAPEKDEGAEEVTMVDYQDPDFGFSMSYPSNWELTTTPTSVILEAPVKVEESEETAEEEGTSIEFVPDAELLDTIVVSRTDAVLTKTSEDTQEDRATEMRTYVTAEYPELASIENELTYVGPDRLLSVRYKTGDGDTLYFIPRAEELFELSYYHESEADADRLENSNVFASLVSGFQFTPYGEGDGAVEEPTEEEEEDVEEEADSDEIVSIAEQVTFSNYHELESLPYEFKMSYPGPWYYAGSSSGYNFGDTPQDAEDSEPIIKLLFNVSSSEGVDFGGANVSVTVEVEGRYYSVTGPTEYESVIRQMADSIVSTKE